jgi:hypothetical protein
LPSVGTATLKTITLMAALVSAVAVSAPARAQFFTGNVNGTPFSGHIMSGPTGFGAGFAQGFANSQANALASASTYASMAAAEANSPYGRCVNMRADAILHQKKLPSAQVARAQMDAARAFCQEAFGSPRRGGLLSGLFGWRR